MPRTRFLVYGALACALVAAPAQAQRSTYLPDDAEIIEYLPSDVFVGLTREGDRTSPNVRFRPGSGAWVVAGYGGSRTEFVDANPRSILLRDGASVRFENGFVGQVIGNRVVGGGIVLNQRSVLELNGGNVGGITPRDQSTVTIRGGTIRNGMEAMDDSVVRVYGGVHHYSIAASGRSEVHIYGGDIRGFAAVSYPGASLRFYGRDLVSELIRPSDPYPDSFDYVVSGTLLDGTVLNRLPVYTLFGGRFGLVNVVSEPGASAVAVGLVAVGGLALRRRRTRKSVACR